MSAEKPMTGRERIMRGYADMRDHALYRNAPGPGPPLCTREEEPEEWRLYFEGCDAKVEDSFAAIRHERELAELVAERIAAREEVVAG